MNALKSLALALSCFTHLPMPRVEWSTDNMRFMIMWLPVVGLVVGAFVALWLLVADLVGFGTVMRAAGLTLVPLAVTGGFHLDGFMDVVDAQSSHGDPEKKRSILKDSHVGAFAPMGLVVYILLYFALATELPAPSTWQLVVLVVCVPVMSRCGSGFASSVFFGNGRGGTLTSFRDSADVKLTAAFVIVCFIAAGIVAALANVLAAALMMVVEIALLAWLNWFAQKNFGGMSGDLSGFFLQTCELLLLACIVVAVKVVGL